MPDKLFSGLEAQLEELERDRRAADANIADWQRSVRPGDKIMQLAQMGSELLIIYGEIVDPVDAEREHYDLDNPSEAVEFEFVQRQYGEKYQKSFRFGRFYSPLCVNGEYGSVHLSMILGVLTHDEFAECQAAKWPQDVLLARAVSRRHACN